MQHVQVGNEVHEFPDEATPEQITQALQSGTPQPAEAPQDTSAASIPAAIVGGLSHAGGKVLQTAGDAGAFLLERLGAISPETQTKINKFTDNSTKIFRYTDDKADPFNQAADAHPIINAAAQVPVYLAGGAAASAPKMLGMLAPAVDAAVATAIGGGMAAGTSQDTQTKAALGSLVGYGVLSAVGKLAGLATAKPLLKEQISQTAAPYQSTDILGALSTMATHQVQTAKTIDAANWKVLQDLPGNINTSIVKSAGTKLAEGLPATAQPQMNAMQDILSSVKNVNTMEDAVGLRNLLKQNESRFYTANGVNKAQQTTYKYLLNNVESQIDNIAQNNGLGPQLKNAKDFYSQMIVPMKDNRLTDLAQMVMQNKDLDQQGINKLTKSIFSGFGKDPVATKAQLNFLSKTVGKDLAEQSFIKSNFDNLLANPESLNPNQLLGTINKWKQQMGPVIGPNNMKVVSGVQQLLTKLGAEGGSKATSLTDRLAGASLGASVGYGLGGPIGAAIGGSAAAYGPALISKLLNSQSGIKALKALHNNPKITEGLKKTISSFTADDLARLTSGE